jgi:hypothetical protein
MNCKIDDVEKLQTTEMKPNVPFIDTGVMSAGC